MARNEPRTRVHASCEQCGHEVSPDDPACPCGASRPESGWPTVTQLVVLPGGPAEPSEEPAEEPAEPEAAPPPLAATAPTAPQRAEAAAATPAEAEEPLPRRTPREPGALGIYLRLVGAFVVAFGMTAGLVLGAWFGWLRPVRRPPPPQPNTALVAPPPVAPRVVVQEPPAPPPVLEPAAEPASEEPPADAVADAAPAPEPAPVHHRTHHRTHHVTRDPQPAAPTVVKVPVKADPAPAPAPVAAAKPASRPAAPPPAPKPPPVPAAVASLSGAYVGRAQGRPLSLTLKFQPGDELAATLMVNDGEDTQTVDATGTWILGDDGSVTIALVENGVADPKAYSGNVDGSRVSGRVTEGRRGRGRFNASR